MAPTKKKPPAGGLPPVKFPGRLEIIQPGGTVIEELPLPDERAPLLADTLIAVLLAGNELRPHLYVAHKASADQLVTALAYVKTAALGGKAGAALRIPQKGAWLSCPRDGKVYAVASSKVLDRSQIAALLKGRAPPPAGGTDASV
jgi:hypothetical protein